MKCVEIIITLEVQRLSNEKADLLVSKGFAKYAPKHVWKKAKAVAQEHHA